MAENNDIQLDQLWYTWSTSGLGSMAMGFRVRAASEGLHDIQSLRYRLVNRFLSYELPQGADVSSFNSRIAPVSLCFVNNGDEKLLIRKVFTGLDAAGRNGNFFTHLIANLPPEFTARDAIRLWVCSGLWADSDQEKASNDTLLPKIPYSTVRYYVQQSQTAFNFTQISEQLKNLLLVILAQGVPAHIYATGHSTFTAALIYGITHCLPMTLLRGLTFTTYESNIKDVEAIVLGTISGANLSDITELHVQPSAPTGPLSPDIQQYVLTALNSLMTGNMTKLRSKVIDEAEKNGFDTTDALLELFKQRFRFGPLTIRQLDNIVRFPNDNVDELLDSGVQQESATLLLNSQEYWQTTGKNLFNGVVAGPQPNVNRTLTSQASEALALFINGVNVYVLATLQTAILQGSLPRQCTEIMVTLAPPKSNAIIYHKMITDFAQGEIYQKVTSDTLWPFQEWVLKCAKLIQPQPTIQQMQPWLRIPAWDKLDTILKHALPGEWEHLAMFGLLERERDIPKSAVQVVQTHEAKFTALLQRLLQQGNQLPKPDYTETVVRFFAAMVEHDYQKRVTLLLDLLNTITKESTTVERLLSIVRLGTTHQLFVEEIETLLANCHPEVIAACSSSPTLAECIRGYMLLLTPGKLANTNVQRLLTQLKGEPSLPPDIADLVAHWTALTSFLHQETINRNILKDMKTALQHLFPAEQTGGNQQPASLQAMPSNNLQRQKIIAELLPLLVKQIKTEYDLETVMEILGPLMTSSPWELLCRMAILAGQSYSHPQLLYRLTPYLLCGINKFPRTYYAPDALDTYLHSLYGNVNDNALKVVDATAVVYGVWPELIQQEWNSWRDRGKAHWGANIPLVNRIIPKPPTGPQPSQQPTPSNSYLRQPAPVSNFEQVQAIQKPRALPPPQPTAFHSQQTQPPPPREQGMSGEQQGNAATHWANLNIPQMQYQIEASVYEHKYTVTVDLYQKLYHILCQMLPYWFKILNEQLTKKQSKSISHEVDTISALQIELYRLSPMLTSSKLISYLVDDVLLQLEYEKLVAKENTAAFFLQPENSLVARREEFWGFVGEPKYQDLCHSYTAEGINDALKLLIRRYHFILYKDDPKKDWWKKWLDKERKQVNIEFPKIIQR